MDEISDFISAKFLDWMKFGFNKLFFALKDEKLAMAFGLKNEDCLRMLFCGLLRRESGRAISALKMQAYFKGKLYVETRCAGSDKKNYYRFVANCEELSDEISPLDDDQPQRWKAFLMNMRNLGEARFKITF